MQLPYIGNKRRRKIKTPKKRRRKIKTPKKTPEIKTPEKKTPKNKDAEKKTYENKRRQAAKKTESRAGWLAGARFGPTSMEFLLWRTPAGLQRHPQTPQSEKETPEKKYAEKTDAGKERRQKKTPEKKDAEKGRRKRKTPKKDVRNEKTLASF